MPTVSHMQWAIIRLGNHHSVLSAAEPAPIHNEVITETDKLTGNRVKI